MRGRSAFFARSVQTKRGVSPHILGGIHRRSTYTISGSSFIESAGDLAVNQLLFNETYGLGGAAPIWALV